MYEINPIMRKKINQEYLAMKNKAREFHKSVKRDYVPQSVIMEVKRDLIFDRIEGVVWRK